jgi:signal transduction histidine kinase
MFRFYPIVCFFTVFLIVPLSSSGKQSPVAPYTDSLYTIADFNKIVSHYRYYRPDSATYFASKGIALARRNKDITGEAIMLNQMGMIKDNLGLFEESRQLYLQALAIYTKANNKKGMATETIRLGVVELRKGNYDKAIGYFLGALRISEQINDQFGIMEGNTTVAEGYMGQREYATALHYLKRAEKVDATIPFSNISLNICNDYGVLYRETGKYDKAIAYFEKGIAQSNTPQYQGLNITLTNNLASVYVKLGRRDKSIQLQKQALEKARAIKNYLREFQTLTGLAATYGKQDAAKALFYYQQALQLVKDKGAHKQAIEILGKMSELYHLQGNYKAAFQAKDEEHAIADQYFYKDMSKQIASLQSEYELHKARARVQELNLANRNQQLQRKVMLSIIVGGVLLMIVVGFFYFKSRHFNILLNKTNKDLKEANTVKDKLFSVLAHDLRSPFVSVINLLYLINDDDLEEEEKKLLIDDLAVTSNASLETLNMLLRWGEMQIKGIRLNPVNLQPKELISRTIAMLSTVAGNKSIIINDETSGNEEVLSDRDHFEFVFRNLLSNAIKFTPEGGTITLHSYNDKDLGEVRFSIVDTGVGIDKDKLESIFSINNVSTNGTNDEKGTSLGLVMCKEFIHANNGRIWVESEPRKGSEFSFALKSIKNPHVS